MFPSLDSVSVKPMFNVIKLDKTGADVAPVNISLKQVAQS